MFSIYLYPFASIFLFTPGLASADPQLPQGIYQGTEVQECGWPTTVYLDDGGNSCTGTLVHPEVVIFAGHCGADFKFALFGEDRADPQARVVETEDCFMVPDGITFGSDIGGCRLAEPVTDVPIVPILMGCELDALQVGAEVSLIGFGQADNGPTGLKRETTAKIAGFPGEEMLITGDDMHSICYGDSGGPVMLQLPDGGWRVFGIASYVIGGCGAEQYFSMMHKHIEKFESYLNVDITPCHTPDGTWDPSPDCGGFALQPGVPAGTWATGCQADAPVSEASAACGPAYGEIVDDEPPQVEIVGLMQGHTYESEGPLPLKITAVASDGAGKPDGWGIAEVRLVFNEKEVPNGKREAGPYTWSVGLPAGGYVISAIAVDHAGNEAYAAPIAIGVNKPAPELPDESTTGELSTTGESETTGEQPTTGADTTDGQGETSSSGGTSEDSATTAAGTDDDGGCGCRQQNGPAAALGLLALLGFRRRRRAA